MSYPVLFLRIKAMMIDSVAYTVLLFVMVLLAIDLEIDNSIIQTSFILAPVMLFEPISVWITGGSIGHHLAGIRVINKNTGENLFVLNGIVRFVAKFLLGVLSLISMLVTKRHQTIHDFVSMSVVVFKNEESVSPNHRLEERELTYTGTKPSFGRRLVVAIAYSVISIICLSLILYLLISPSCININRCTEIERLRIRVGGWIWVTSAVFFVLMSLFSKLPGAYYKGKGLSASEDG